MQDRAASRLDTLLFAVALLASTPTIAAQPPVDAEESPAVALFASSFVAVEPSVVIRGRDDMARTRAGRDLQRFLARHPGPWEARWDLRGDRPHLIQGAGVPLLPGRGNRLTRGELGLPADGPLRLADVEARLRAFLAELPELSGDPATYQAVVDAATAEVLQLADTNSHARVTGGIQPKSPLDPEEVRGLPLVLVDTASGSRTTDLDGNYAYPGGTASSRLTGRFIRVVDSCGSRLLEDSTTGDLAFGTSGGTDCATPGFGGLGNTHASRTAYYHLTRVHSKARTYFPLHSWLNNGVTANVNINSTCNAFWNGTTLNFYRSGGGCSNTGEIASILVHEWGHGMDANTGGVASERASQEALGDTFAFLETRDSCIGPSFQPGISCPGCTASCRGGVRDLSAFAAGGPRTIARPSTITDDNGINCDVSGCPSFFSSRGPMGYEGRCESYIASTANWDLARKLAVRWGTEAGWQRMERIWHLSLPAAQSAYRVVSGGTCNPAAQVDGCGASNWYTVYLAVDDDDGNLANGTPNGCRIWDAFHQHGIACGSRPACTSGGPRLTGAVPAGEYVFHDEDVIVDDVTVTGTPGSSFVVRVHGGSLHVDNLIGTGAPGAPGQGGGNGFNVVLETWPSQYGNTNGPWPITIGPGGIGVAGGRGGDGASGTDAFEDGCPDCQVTLATRGQLGGGGGRGGAITIRASGDLLLHGGLNASGGDGGQGGSGGSAWSPGTSPQQGGPGGNGGAGGSVTLEHTASAPADARIEIVLDANSNGGVATAGGAGGGGGSGGSGGDGGSTPERGANGGHGGSGGPITITGRNLIQLGWNLLGHAIGANVTSHGGHGGGGGNGGQGSNASIWSCRFDCHNICHPIRGTQGAAGGLGGSGGPGGPITIGVTDDYSSSWSGVATNGGDGGPSGFSGTSGFDRNLCEMANCPGGFIAFAGVPGQSSGGGGSAAVLRVTADTIDLGPLATLASQGGDGAAGPPGGEPGDFCCPMDLQARMGQGSQGGQGGSGGSGADIVLTYGMLDAELGSDAYFPCGGNGGNGGDGSTGQPAGIGGLGGALGGNGSLVHNGTPQAPTCTASGGTMGNPGGDRPDCEGS
jgi:hypothetical protein